LNKHVANIVEFLRNNGLEVQAGKTSENSFLPHVEIVHGRIIFDPEHAVVSDLLHEAGHLMLCPPQYREQLHKNLYKGFRHIFATVDTAPDSALHWYLMAMDDHAVTAWAWALGKHLGVPENEIILSEQYSGDGDSIRTCLQLRSYIGINGLSHAKYCDLPQMARYKEDAICYPQMRKWSPSL